MGKVILSTKKLTHEGLTLSVGEWAVYVGISLRSFKDRMKQKPRSQWFIQNTRKPIIITYNGVTRPVAEWARLTGIYKQTLIYRYRQGMSPAEIFSYKSLAPVRSGRRIPPEPVIKPVLKPDPEVFREDGLARVDSLRHGKTKWDRDISHLKQDPDLPLKRFIEYWQAQGLADDEIMIKYRVGNLEAAA